MRHSISLFRERCPYCGATPGRPHRKGCGIVECRRRGWFAVLSPDGQSGYIPCSKDTPGAIEDLNRWEYFRATGEDTLYAGQTH
jgi:hypothetical protein